MPYLLCLQGKVYIVDFNPFGPVTDALLFTWQELQQLDVTTNTSVVRTGCIFSLEINVKDYK